MNKIVLYILSGDNETYIGYINEMIKINIIISLSKHQFRTLTLFLAYMFGMLTLNNKIIMFYSIIFDGSSFQY